MPHDDNQHHPTHTGGAHQKTSTGKPRATSQVRLRSDHVECPTNWIQAQMIQNPVPTSWWRELRSIYRECVEAQHCHGAATRPAADFILLAASCPGEGVRLVGDPMQFSRVVWLGLSALP